MDSDRMRKMHTDILEMEDDLRDWYESQVLAGVDSSNAKFAAAQELWNALRKANSAIVKMQES